MCRIQGRKHRMGLIHSFIHSFVHTCSLFTVNKIFKLTVQMRRKDQKNNILNKIIYK